MLLGSGVHPKHHVCAYDTFLFDQESIFKGMLGKVRPLLYPGQTFLVKYPCAYPEPPP